MRNRLPYGIQPAPPDLRLRPDGWLRFTLALLIGAVILAVVFIIAPDDPPPPEKSSDTIFGLSEAE